MSHRNLSSLSASICPGLRGRTTAVSIAQALHFLHSRRIVHLDLTSHNILLSRDGAVAKLDGVELAQTLGNQCATLILII